jgi:hypothetical protein
MAYVMLLLIDCMFGGHSGATTLHPNPAVCVPSDAHREPISFAGIASVVPGGDANETGW